MKTYTTTKRGQKVAASITMPPTLADEWLAASAIEGVSRQEFLRRSLAVRAKEILSTYAKKPKETQPTVNDSK